MDGWGSSFEMTLTLPAAIEKTSPFLEMDVMAMEW
jgi:hypothetical protein